MQRVKQVGCARGDFVAAFMFGAVTVGGGAIAADFPNKAVRMVTGSAPGGGSDTVARVIAEKLNERFGQPMLVDNRAGAGGTIGADIVAKAPPDGYTWLVATSSSMVVNPAMQKISGSGSGSVSVPSVSPVFVTVNCRSA